MSCTVDGRQGKAGVQVEETERRKGAAARFHRSFAKPKLQDSLTLANDMTFVLYVRILQVGVLCMLTPATYLLQAGPLVWSGLVDC